MATVVDKSGNTPVVGKLDTTITVDHKYHSVNRKLSATPIGATVPLFTGEIVEDTTNEKIYRAIGTTNTDWEPVVRAFE